MKRGIKVVHRVISTPSHTSFASSISSIRSASIKSSENHKAMIRTCFSPAHSVGHDSNPAIVPRYEGIFIMGAFEAYIRLAKGRYHQ